MIIRGTVFLSHKHSQNHGNQNRPNTEKNAHTSQHSTSSKKGNFTYVENPLNLPGVHGIIYTVRLSSSYGHLLLVQPSDRIVNSVGELDSYAVEIQFSGEGIIVVRYILFYFILFYFISFHLAIFFSVYTMT